MMMRLDWAVLPSLTHAQHMATGAVDVEVESYTLLNAASELPFEPSYGFERGLVSQADCRTKLFM